MAVQPSDPAQLLLDDPNDPGRKGIIDAVKVVASGLHDGSANGGLVWTKAKNLTRSDAWSLSGFGTSDAFNSWSIEEMNKLATAFELHLGRKYGRQMYICCCSAAHEK
ncbi:MAG: hypothetical protein KC643_26410 [Nitrospira sp.]|nr:hypothetical protein [Nitrospira sp.]HQU29484.1 hypothetical protein [Nitrospirales bacterium]